MGKVNNAYITIDATNLMHMFLKAGLGKNVMNY